MTTPLYQRTLSAPISATGIGLHSGKQVTLTLRPAKADTGIIFVRTDLEGAIVPMDAFLMQDTLMSSNLVKDGVRVGTIEHLLSAVAAAGIDNLVVEVSAQEMPIMDGSAIQFVELINKAGIEVLDIAKTFIKIIKPIKVEDGDKWASLCPCDEGFLMNFEIAFEHPAIKATPQKFGFALSKQGFADEVAAARTFGFLSDLDYLKKNNLAQGASYDNAIVLDDCQVVNGALRYPDEFVRHKMLDAVGDLYVIGKAILGRFDAYKSGHALNNKLILAVLNDPSSYQIVTFYDKNTCPIAY